MFTRIISKGAPDGFLHALILMLLLMSASYLFTAGTLRVLAWIVMTVQCWIEEPEDKQSSEIAT